jgi:hypothetical protein
MHIRHVNQNTAMFIALPDSQVEKYFIREFSGILCPVACLTVQAISASFSAMNVH